MESDIVLYLDEMLWRLKVIDGNPFLGCLCSGLSTEAVYDKFYEIMENIP